MIIIESGIKHHMHVRRVLHYVLLESKVPSTELIITRYVSGQRAYYRAIEGANDDPVAHSIIQEARIEKILRKIETTCEHRKHKRKDNNLCFHTVISFHRSEDRLTKEEMLHFMHTYITDRFPKSVLLMLPHTRDAEHLHFHCIASATDIRGNGVWLSKDDHLAHKIRMQDFANQTFDLKYSTVSHGSSKKKDY